MTIEQIGVGAAPGDNTGDGLRTAMTKVNNNFSNSLHAASKLTGTAPENVPLNSDLGDSSTRDVGLNTGDVLSPEGAGLDSGETNWTSGNMTPSAVGGVNVRVIALYNSGVPLSFGDLVNGTAITLAHCPSGTWIDAGVVVTGTWRYVGSTFLLTTTQYGEFLRVEGT